MAISVKKKKIHTAIEFLLPFLYIARYWSYLKKKKNKKKNINSKILAGYASC
jgi:hypothetical protein